ncbi:MAG: hypothetical protein AAB473_01005 [Patescibacteria group bacterium]
MNQRTAFFDVLTEELPADVWGLRLQEELSAHLEDAVYFGALEGKSETIAEEQALADLGSPKLILQEFRHAMTYTSPQAFVLHAIGVGLLASPIVFVATIFFIIATPVSVPVYAILLALYIHALAPIFRHIESGRMARTITAIATGVPFLIITIPFVYSVVTAFDATVGASDKPYLLITSILAGLINITAGIIATRYLLKKAAIEKSMKKHPERKVSSTPLNVSAIIFTVFVILSTIAQHNPTIQQLRWLPELRWIIDRLFTVSNTLSDIIPPVTTVWITGIIFCGVAMIGAYFVGLAIRDRAKKIATPFPWAWLAVTVYTITLIAFPPTVSTLSVSWSDLPNISISERVERQELGPLYGMAKYLNRISQNVFSYHLSNPDLGGTFEIQQYPNHVFTISNIASVDSYNITSRIEDTVSFSSSTSIVNIWCHYFPTDALQTDPPMTPDQRVDLWNGAPMFCSDLYVGEKKIFDAPQGIDIGRDASITVSTDGKWLLFAHGVDSEIHGSFSPTEIHLIDLR